MHAELFLSFLLSACSSSVTPSSRDAATGEFDAISADRVAADAALEDASCSGTDAGCMALPNDTCASAVVLPGPGIYRGTTHGHAHNYDLFCGAAIGSHDAIFRYANAAPMDGGFASARVVVAPRTSSPYAVLISGACPGALPSGLCASADDGGMVTDEGRMIDGEYTIYVESAESMDFTLSLSFP